MNRRQFYRYAAGAAGAAALASVAQAEENAPAKRRCGGLFRALKGPPEKNLKKFSKNS